jgi:hypothetical protein
MTKEAQNPNREAMSAHALEFAIRASSFIRHSEFDIRHSSPPLR